MTAKLIYFATRSLDGYIEDEQGKLDWTTPDEDEERQQFGGGKKALPDGVRLELELVDERRFKGSGVVHLHYRRRTA